MLPPVFLRAASARSVRRHALKGVLLTSLLVGTSASYSLAGDPVRDVVGERPAAAAAAAPRPSAVASTEVPSRVAAPAKPVRIGPPPGPAPMSMDDPIQGGLTARQAQARSAAVRAAHRDAGLAPASATWTPALGLAAAARARSWLGLPYSWAGGTGTGPSTGRCEKGSGADLDCRIVGFDCSGLMIYAWAPYRQLPHFAQFQAEAGRFRPTVAQLQPGDLVFFSSYIPDGIGHVAIYDGNGMAIEAPQSGGVVQRVPLAQLMRTDGTYRGAVRPLTDATPTLSDGTRTSTRGGTVTLRGTGLDGVDRVTVGDRVVRTFVRRSAGALTLRVPAHRAGTVAVVAHTAWGDASQPSAITFVAPPRATPRRAPSSAPVASSPRPRPSVPPVPRSTPPRSTPARPSPSSTSPTPTPSVSVPSSRSVLPSVGATTSP